MTPCERIEALKLLAARLPLACERLLCMQEMLRLRQIELQNEPRKPYPARSTP